MAAADAEFRCFVGGLAWATDNQALENAFSQFGEIVDAKIINDRETGRSRGFGFVTYSSEQSMRDAIEAMNGQSLDGRNITVNEAQSRGSGGGGSGPRGGGGYNSGGNYGSGGGYKSGGRREGGGGRGYGGGRREGGGGRGYGGGGRDRGYGGGSGGVAEYLGFSSPFGGMGGMGGAAIGGMRGTRFSSSMFGDDMFGSMFGDDMFGSSFGGAPPKNVRRVHKAPPIENTLACSLEELYKGTTKKMKISREIANASGRTMPVEEILTIDVKPGWKKGTKITFPEKGNEQPGVVPADIVFVIDEKPHPVFTRDGNDLVVTQKVSLVEALTGYTVNLTTLDGRRLTIPVNSVINPNYEEVVPREGMPIPKDPSRKGNLKIKFDRLVI